MNNTENDENQTEKKAKQMETARKIWMFITPLFALIGLFSLYNWTQSSGGRPTSALSQFGMVFVGLSIIVGKRNKTLSYVLLAAGMILVLAGLVSVIMDLMD